MTVNSIYGSIISSIQGSSCFPKGIEVPPSAWLASRWSFHISCRADWLKGKNAVQLVQTQLVCKKISDQISFPSCAIFVEIGVIEKWEIQMFCYNIVGNSRMNCIFKHIDMFLTLKWDLVTPSFPRMCYYLSPLLFKSQFYYTYVQYF